jgi:hypothetical protein
MVSAAEPFLEVDADDRPALDDTPLAVALSVGVDSTARSPGARNSKSPNQPTLRITSTARISSFNRSPRLGSGRGAPLDENRPYAADS